MYRFFAVSIVIVLLTVVAYSQQPSDRVARVASGELREAKASWWGFDPADSTGALQAAIDSKVPRLVIDKQASAWVAGPLVLRDNQEILFEEGVELLAKAGAFHGLTESLLSASNVKNLKLIGLGQGAVLRMRKSDYHAEPYRKSEWRHGIALRSVENVTVENLSIVASGGDGIYLGVASRGVPCRNVTVKNVVCDDNNRQGISVISADKLLIEDCVLKNTWGTPPAAGIDFEPNSPDEQLTDCIMRNCLVENNDGDGIVFYLKHLIKSARPISVRVEHCTVNGSKGFGFRYILGDEMNDKIKGTCDVIGCRFENCDAGGIVVEQKDAGSSMLRMHETVVIHCGKDEKNNPPIRLITEEFVDFGGIDFGGIVLTDSFDRRPLQLSGFVGHPQKVSGTLYLRQGGVKSESVAIDDAWFAKEFPKVLRRIPLVEPMPEQWVPVVKANIDIDTKFPPIWQRSRGVYWIYAEQEMPIRFALDVRKIGRYELGKSTAVLTLPDGTNTKFDIPVEKAGDFEFVLDNAPESGVYRLQVDVGSHAVQMSRCNQTVVLPTLPRLDLISTAATLFLHVPQDATEFGIRVRGDMGEGVKASVVDPSGNTVWVEDNIDAVQFDRTTQDGKIDGLWQIVLERPSGMAFEDYHVIILGVPPLLGLNP